MAMASVAVVVVVFRWSCRVVRVLGSPGLGVVVVVVLKPALLKPMPSHASRPVGGATDTQSQQPVLELTETHTSSSMNQFSTSTA